LPPKYGGRASSVFFENPEFTAFVCINASAFRPTAPLGTPRIKSDRRRSGRIRNSPAQVAHSISNASLGLTLTHCSIRMTNTKILIERAAANSHLLSVATLVFSLPRDANVEENLWRIIRPSKWRKS
jgi:hypothetical protein